MPVFCASGAHAPFLTARGRCAALLAGLVLVMPFVPARAETDTAALRAMCESRYNVDQGYCAGYIAAVSDILRHHALYGYRVCAHGAVRPVQLQQLYTRALKSGRLNEGRPAPETITRTLHDAFGCRE